MTSRSSLVAPVTPNSRNPRRGARRTHAARFVAGVPVGGRFPALAAPEVAFAGRSNVGKSSLINRLVGQRGLARVSKTPGRTQQINYFLIDERMVFADLPGYGFARVPLAVKAQWKELVETYLSTRRALRGVVVIVDIRRGLQDDDAQLLDFLTTLRLPVILVATKGDKITFGERQRRGADLGALAAQRGAHLVVCSALTGEGLDAVWQAVEQACAAGAHGAATR